MAVAPLFITDMTTLRLRLRLDGANEASVLAMIDAAVQQSRARFYKELGAPRVIEILATAYTENPTDEAGALRLQANAVELMLVKIQLLRALPVLFMDSSGARRENWNEEGLSRKADERFVAAEIKRLESEIASAFEDLVGTVDDESAGGVRASCIGPEFTPLPPGFSVFGTSNPAVIADLEVQGGCL